MTPANRQEAATLLVLAINKVPREPENMDLIGDAYVAVGYLMAGGEDAPEEGRRPIDLAEADAIRLSDRQPLIGG